MEESDHLKDFDYNGEINPIFHIIKVADFNYGRSRPPPFTTCTQLSPVTRGLVYETRRVAICPQLATATEFSQDEIL